MTISKLSQHFNMYRVRICRNESVVLVQATLRRQKEKIVTSLAFDSSMPSGGKIFTNFLLLALVCPRPMSQKENIGKQLKNFIITSFAHRAPH